MHALNNKYFFGFLICISVLIRLVLMPITLHTDLLHIWSVPALALEGIWDPYSHATQNYSQIASGIFDVYYGPFSYISNAIFMFFLRPFSVTLVPWLTEVRNMVFSLSDFPLEAYFSSLSQKDLLTNLFLLKFPYLVYESIVIWGIWIFSKNDHRKLLVTVWLFNPVVIYSTYIMGQNDVFTAGILLMAVLAGSRRRVFLSTLLLVLGIMIKTLPIVLIPVFSFIFARSWFGRLKHFGLTLSLFALLNIPWTKDAQRLVIAYFPPVMASPIDLALRPDSMITMLKLALSLLTASWLFFKIVIAKKIYEPNHLIELTTIALLLFFSAYRGALLNHYIVLIPFLLFKWSHSRHLVGKMYLFSALLFVTHIYTRPLQWELFAPLRINAISSLPSTREMINPLFKYEHLSLLTGFVVGLWMLYECFTPIKSLSPKKLMNFQHGRCK